MFPVKVPASAIAGSRSLAPHAFAAFRGIALVSKLEAMDFGGCKVTEGGGGCGLTKMPRSGVPLPKLRPHFIEVPVRPGFCRLAKFCQRQLGRRPAQQPLHGEFAVRVIEGTT